MYRIRLDDVAGHCIESIKIDAGGDCGHVVLLKLHGDKYCVIEAVYECGEIHFEDADIECTKLKHQAGLISDAEFDEWAQEEARKEKARREQETIDRIKRFENDDSAERAEYERLKSKFEPYAGADMDRQQGG